MEAQPKTYLQARDECWNAYREENPDMSEYMERDYKDGFHDGYNAALHDRERELRERAAIAAMQGLLSNHLWMSNVAKATLEKSNGNMKDGSKELKDAIVSDSIEIATALISQLNTPQS